ncbi:MAG: efflux RND transporter permease subunit [Rhodospirillales bacterium]|nr:efflux RND transporter permease subunit [Rhodospirillales bacterium]
MNPIKISIERPVAIMAAVLMVIMFGVAALFTIPIQLTPDVRKPIISIQTRWPGAAPAEVEREIVNPQENELRGLEGLETITSQAQNGRALVVLEFDVNQDMNKALLLVANRLDRVGDYPDEANEPTLKTSSTEDNPIAWILIGRQPGNDMDLDTYGDFVEDIIKDRLERVPGVSLVNVYGGSERQMQVIVDPARMAYYGLTVSHVLGKLRAANASISAGDVDEGKRRYVVRSEGELSTIGNVRDVVLRTDHDPETGRVARVTVGDIADVGIDYAEAESFIRFLGNEAIAINAVRETGANVIETMKGIRQAIAELNQAALPEAGLHLTQVYDETVYIDSAIDLVQQNIIVGGTLAALILLLFLRSMRATLVVSMAIPVSVVGAFVAMALLGRSLNVISLAGLAFAIGMVVDAAIVVIENIYRLREEGLSRTKAAFQGASQVWGAVLVSALTTVVVFIPILVMKLEVGQLFRDIAVALSASVLLSLVVSVTVIPALSKKLLGDPRAESKARSRLPAVDRFAGFFVNAVLAFTRGVARSRLLAVIVVAMICGAGLLTTYFFLPKLDYLPNGNRNLLSGVIVPPPGYNLKTMAEIAIGIESEIRHLWSSETGPRSEPGQPPKIQRFFFVAHSGSTYLGAASEEPGRVKELLPVLQKASFHEPGTFGFISQRSLFGRGISGARRIDLNISGPELEVILDVARQAAILVDAAMPRAKGTQIRPQPGLELGAPEVRIIPNRTKLADNGVTARELGETIDTFNDGLRVAEITADGKRIDLVLKGPLNRIMETQGINNLPVVTQSGTILPTSSLADIVVTTGPTEIRHIERSRTVTLQIRPPAKIPLEAALDTLTSEVIDKLRAGGLPDGIMLRLAGTADQLSATWDAMVGQLLMSLAIVYLVMAVLFESFTYPLIIMLSVPLATAGGIGGLALLNLFTFQPLDMLTMLGFIILVGIVVNNAILLVHQTLHHLHKEGMSFEDSILAATRNRIRPIFMSTLTSVFGMLPLVVFPGAGSELYRGLGSVVVGGLALSAVLTLAIVPPLLSLVASFVEPGRKKTIAAEGEEKPAV